MIMCKRNTEKVKSDKTRKRKSTVQKGDETKKPPIPERRIMRIYCLEEANSRMGMCRRPKQTKQNKRAMRILPSITPFYLCMKQS